MGKMNELTLAVRELEDQMVTCIRCGMCQSVCPLFEQTHREADVARGKLALLNGLMEKAFSDPDGVNNRLNKCLLCGSCAANCPSGVNILEIFIRARAILTDYNGLSAAKKLVFRRMLSNPKTFNALLSRAGKFQKLMIKGRKNDQGTSCARFISPLLKSRHFIPMADTPFHKHARTLEPEGRKSGIRVAFFTGCLIDKLLPQIGLASIKALKHHGITVHIPENQGCCGIPALASGDQSTFNTLVEHHIELFSHHGFDYLLTACATCTSTIKKLWPALYPVAEGSRKAALDKLADKTMDINQFFADVLNVRAIEASGPAVTYHDPCHLKKSLGVFKQPRQLIQASGHSLVEMDQSDKCCGMGGSFNLYHYEISKKIGTLKQKNITATGCSTVTSGCPACILQISDMLSQSGADIRVRHPVELYADALDNL